MNSVAAYHLPGFLAQTAAGGQCGVTGNLVLRNHHAAAGPHGTTVVVGSALYVLKNTVQGFMAVFSRTNTLLYCVPLFNEITVPFVYLTQPSHVAVFHNIAFVVGQSSTGAPAIARLDLRTYAPNPPGSLVQFDTNDLLVVTPFNDGFFSSICSGGAGTGHCDCADCEHVLPPLIWAVGAADNDDAQHALLVSFDTTTLASGSPVFARCANTQAADATYMTNGHIAIACNTLGGVDGPGEGFLWRVNPANTSEMGTTSLGWGDTFPICVRIVPETGVIMVLAYYVDDGDGGPVVLGFTPDGTEPTNSGDSSATPNTYAYQEPLGMDSDSPIFFIPTDMVVFTGGEFLILVGNFTYGAALDQQDPLDGSERPSFDTAITSCTCTPWGSGFIGTTPPPVPAVMVIPTTLAPAVSQEGSSAPPVYSFGPFPAPYSGPPPGMRWAGTLVGSGATLRTVGDFTSFEAVRNIPGQPASIVIMSTDLIDGGFFTFPVMPARPAIDVDPFTGVVAVDCAPLPTLLAVHGGTDISGDAAIAGSLDVGGSAHIHGSETVNGCLNVHERVHIGGCLDVCGSADVRGAVTAHGLVTADDGLVVHGGATVHGLLTADCGAEVVGHLCVTQAVTIGPAGDIPPVPGTIQYSGGYYWGWIQTGTESSHDSSPGRPIYNWVRFAMDYSP